MIRRWANTILAALALIGAAMIYRKGRKDADDANAVQDFNEYVAARKRMDAVDGAVDGFDDANAVSEWLRDRAKRGGGL